MSKLFRTSLKKILAEVDQSPPIEEWDRDGIAAMSLAVQIGILERLELMVELQAMLMATAHPALIGSPADKLRLQLKYHYGWKSTGA